MGFRDILEIHQLSGDTLGISMYTYPPEKKTVNQLESVRALASSTRNLESGNLFFLTKIWPQKNLLAHLQRLRCATLWDGGFWTMLHPMGQTFVDLKLCTACESTDCLRNFCPTTLQPANWTLKIDVTVLHFDGTMANHKEIGLGHLLPSWVQDDSFTRPS